MIPEGQGNNTKIVEVSYLVKHADGSYYAVLSNGVETAISDETLDMMLSQNYEVKEES